MIAIKPQTAVKLFGLIFIVLGAGSAAIVLLGNDKVVNPIKGYALLTIIGGLFAILISYLMINYRKRLQDQKLR